MAKDLEMGYLLDFYGEVLTEKQREMLRQYYNDDLSLSEIGENFGITRQCAGCHQAWRERAEGAGGKGRLCGALPPRAAEAGRAGANGDRCTVRVHRPQGLTTTEYEHQLTKMLKLIRSIDEANES